MSIDLPNSEPAPESHNPRSARVAYRLARWSLAAFLTTFITARLLVIGIMSHTLPDFYLHVGGNHVHHLNYGIFLLSGVGAYLLFFRPRGKWLNMAASIYGVGLALTFDEFGMWLHLGGAYWQRASFDAVVVIAAILGLISVAPEWKKLGPGHWRVTLALALLSIIFGGFLFHSVREFGNRIAPSLQRLEANQPQ